MVTEQIEQTQPTEEHMNFAMKMAEELREDLVKAFKRLAEQNNTTEEKIQLALRFRDLPENQGEMFFQLMIGFKPEREANFNRDFLGMVKSNGEVAKLSDDEIKNELKNKHQVYFDDNDDRAKLANKLLIAERKAAMFPDDTGKESFIKIYVLGYPPLHIEGLFTTLAKKYDINKWSELSGIFYKKDANDPIKLGIFVPIDGKIKKVEKIDIFNTETEPEITIIPPNQTENKE